jgi:hypothetical protein
MELYMGRVPALQVRSPEFKPQSHQKTKQRAVDLPRCALCPSVGVLKNSDYFKMSFRFDWELSNTLLN